LGKRYGKGKRRGSSRHGAFDFLPEGYEEKSIRDKKKKERAEPPAGHTERIMLREGVW